MRIERRGSRVGRWSFLIALLIGATVAVGSVQSSAAEGGGSVTFELDADIVVVSEARPGPGDPLRCLTDAWLRVADWGEEPIYTIELTDTQNFWSTITLPPFRTEPDGFIPSFPKFPGTQVFYLASLSSPMGCASNEAFYAGRFTIDSSIVTFNDRIFTGGCFGRTATIVARPGIPTVGTDGPDTIVGTRGPDDIDGRAGNDRICSLEGRDTVRGREGNDRINLGGASDTGIGGPGDDRIAGSTGADLIRGNSGDDQLEGNRGDDVLLGGTGRDVLQGNTGDDELVGERGNDMLFGGKDDDVLRGRANADELRGQSGNDRLFGGSGPDVLIGGTGSDTCNGGSGVNSISC